MLLRRSRSFKVIEVGTNRKPICDFLKAEGRQRSQHETELCAEKWSVAGAALKKDKLSQSRVNRNKTGCKKIQE